MFRKPTSKSRKPTGCHKLREPYKSRTQKAVISLSISIPRELVHFHNAQPPKSLAVVSHDDEIFNPVCAAQLLRIVDKERQMTQRRKM